jgi:four helix bundle protein
LALPICQKEAAETECWLELALEPNLVASTQANDLLQEVRELFADIYGSGRIAKSHC